LAIYAAFFIQLKERGIFEEVVEKAVRDVDMRMHYSQDADAMRSWRG
jgi:hypothetical protein